MRCRKLMAAAITETFEACASDRLSAGSIGVCCEPRPKTLSSSSHSRVELRDGQVLGRGLRLAQSAAPGQASSVAEGSTV